MNHNPIKHVKFSDIDYFQPTVNSGGSNRPFKPVTNEFRQQLMQSVKLIKAQLASVDNRFSIGVAAAVVELESKAVAKSHRPRDVFNQKTCEFIGDIGFARYLIKATDAGLLALSEKIQTASSKAAIKDLSTIKSIEAYQVPVELSQSHNAVGVRLFDFKSSKQNQLLADRFEACVQSMGGEFIKHPSNFVRLYKVMELDSNAVRVLSKFMGVKSVMASNAITVAPMALSKQVKKVPTMYPPDHKDYPVVGVVDSGVSSNCTPIDPWIVDRKVYVADSYRDFNHGTFVSGLVASSFHLNGQDVRFPKCQSKILSVEVLGQHSGDIFDVVYAMYEASIEYPNVKVWNLSLGDNTPVSMSAISDMALMLDEFQDRNHCLCVVAAGNYNQTIRGWPASNNLDDRIASPGDSVRSITVGSIAHVDGLVKNHEPSHFSRRGPVSNYLQKPELVHFGGNILLHNNRQVSLGVNSVGADGYRADDIGTSFAAPLVSSVAANLFHQIGENASATLVKALMVHGANLNKLVDSSENEAYYGWGVPKDSQSILEVMDYESTVVFEGTAHKSFEVRKLPFPIPDCLRTEDGKVRGEFYITLVYQPELDPQKVFEYCQVDLSVGLGRQEGAKFNSKVPLQTNASKFEKELIKSGDKWSPIKVYKKAFPRGVDVEHWKLRVSMLERDGYDASKVAVPFVIVLTIRDIDKQQPVYNQMARLMEDYNWEVTDLIMDTQTRVR